MYLIRNMRGLFLTKDNTGFVKLRDFEEVKIFPLYITASQKAMSLGLAYDSVVSVQDLMANLLANLSPLEDSFHDLLTTRFELVELAEVGGFLEVKDALEQSMKENKYLSSQLDAVRRENERLSLQIEEIGKLLKNCK